MLKGCKKGQISPSVQERVLKLADCILLNQTNIKAAAKALDMSYSIAKRDIHDRLPIIDKNKYDTVKNLKIDDDEFNFKIKEIEEFRLNIDDIIDKTEKLIKKLDELESKLLLGSGDIKDIKKNIVNGIRRYNDIKDLKLAEILNKWY